MRLCLAVSILCFLALLPFSIQQDSDLIKPVWVSGDNNVRGSGVFGEKGVANSTCNPSGRHTAAGWYDQANREVWIYGGYGTSGTDGNGFLGDMWRFRLNDSTWTWIAGSDEVAPPMVYGTRGVADLANTPGGRQATASWYDPILREFWMFGGSGFFPESGISGRGSDLWKFSMDKLTWTWVAGPQGKDHVGVYGTLGVADAANFPGARESSIMFADPANRALYLFGGHTQYEIGEWTQGPMNDLWRYSLIENTWTWIGGTNLTDHPGVNGTRGQASTANIPSSRCCMMGWTDEANREFWLFGGSGNDGTYDDLWRYRVSDGTWTWVSGSGAINSLGSYGTQGVADPSNSPPARSSSSGWFDPVNRSLWLFGGPETNGPGNQNDLWVFSLSDSIWTWMAGQNTTNSQGVRGEMGTPDVSNIPSARYTPVVGADATGSLVFLFGGYGTVSEGQTSFLLDFWLLRNVTPPAAPIMAPVTEPQMAPIMAPQTSSQVPTGEQLGNFAPFSAAASLQPAAVIFGCSSLLMFLILFVAYL